MGIQGLLPLLKSIMAPIHMKDLEGCCVAVDTYSWLHKGALSCSRELCKGQPTSKHIDYCMHRVNLLRHYGVKPVLVFDGGLLPMKSEQEIKRARARKENLARAIEHESNGNTSSAYECYQKAVDISPLVAYELIQVLKQENVYYVVAPYEADAQMTYLAVSKQVDAVITEDSDLIAFGCPRIIYKMDKFGQGVEYQYSMLHKNKELNLSGFTKQMLLEMCILSGCDYLQSLPGVGLKKAHALIKKFKSYDMVIKHLKYSTIAVSPSYEESFKKAILTFQHQRVYDPEIEDIVYLSDLAENIGDDLDFLGPSIPQHIAKGIARGDLDPFTKMPFQEVNNVAGSVVDSAYHLKYFKPERKKLDLPAQKNLLTNYFCFASLEARRKFRAPRNKPKHLTPMDENYSPMEHVTKEAAACKSNCPPASPLDSRYSGIISHPENCVGNGFVTKSPVSLESPSHGLEDKKDILDDKRSPQDPLLQHSRHSIHKPCTTLHKEHEWKLWKSVSSADEGKMRTANADVVVRSSYLQRNSEKDSVVENQNGNLHEKDYITIDKCKNTIIEFEYKLALDAGDGTNKMKNKNAIMRSPYFQHKSEKDSGNENLPLVKDDLSTHTCETAIPESDSGDIVMRSSYYKSAKDSVMENQNGDLCEKDDFTIDKCKNVFLEFEYKPASDAGDGKNKTRNRKNIVRSSYFQHKSEKENDQNSRNENLPVKDDLCTHTCENAIPERACGETYFNRSIMKRKVTSIDSDEKENMNYKCIRTNASLSNQSNCNTTLNDADLETKAEELKFGSNISHLENYSDISEKSMERFVSVISSFRYSSGSHASGLRAPLKDVRNTITNRSGSHAGGLCAPVKDVRNTITKRSTVGIDFSNFAYVPTNQKASSAHR